jgi:hypothetical protein
MAQQIKKKFIGNDQVGKDKILIEDGGAIRALDGTTEVNLINISSNEVFLKGVKVLDSSNLIPAAILPSFVDDVLEFADLASLPTTGETGKIYVTLDTNKQYRWSGSTYVQITSGAVDSVNNKTGIVVLDASDIQMASEAVSVDTKITSLESQLGDLQAVTYVNEKFIVNAQIIADGSLVLSNVPQQNSIVAFVDRLGIFEGADEDFVISGNVMTFVNSLSQSGSQKLEIGDEIRVKYRS